jgi:endonuclease-3
LITPQEIINRLKKYKGKVPNNFSDLEKLPGVGHKTASVVMSQGFGIPAFAVDTHIHRLAQRWGLTNGKSVKKTEEDLKIYGYYFERDDETSHGIECKICKSCYPKRKRPFVHKRP